MNEQIELDDINPDEVIATARLIYCLYCGNTGYYIAPTGQELKTPEGWQAITAHGINQRVGYLCPDCWKEVNKPVSYSIEINGEIVQPPKTITSFKDKEDSAI